MESGISGVVNSEICEDRANGIVKRNRVISNTRDWTPRNCIVLDAFDSFFE